MFSEADEGGGGVGDVKANAGVFSKGDELADFFLVGIGEFEWSTELFAEIGEFERVCSAEGRNNGLKGGHAELVRGVAGRVEDAAFAELVREFVRDFAVVCEDGD